jgi:hypothetical protein
MWLGVAFHSQLFYDGVSITINIFFIIVWVSSNMLLKLITNWGGYLTEI